MKHPNPEQLAKLEEYAAKYGKDWKTELYYAWRNGADANEPDGHLLRQIRNQLGPRWLHNFKL